MARAGGKTHPARQRGQSLVLGSLLLMVVMVVLLLMFNAAQLTSAKMELQNTADATAYSVATVAARDYNFSAYMNRALVANQVAAAQVVGLTSWSRFVGQTLENIALLCAPIPGADVICASIAATYKEYEEAFETTVLPPLMKLLNYWMVALSDLQMAFHLGNVEAIARNVDIEPKVHTGVLARNDPDAALVRWPDSKGDIPGDLYSLAILIKDAVDWWKYTKHYSNTDEMGRFADVTNESLDDFSNSRRWKDYSVTIHDTGWILEHFLKFVHIPKWLQDAIDAVLPISASMTMTIVRRGGTELKDVEKKYSWSAVDTLITKIKIHITVKHVPCWKHHHPALCNVTFDSPTVPLPVGWGAVYSPTAEGDSGAGIFDAGGAKRYGGAADGWEQMVAFDLAVGEFGKEPMAPFGGLKPYYDIADTAAKTRVGPEFTFVVSKKTDKTRTASRAGFGAPAKAVGPFGLDNLRLDDPADPDYFYAIAKGRLNFAQSNQYSNLFSPYWEAKLADTTNSERALAYEALSGDWKRFFPSAAAAAKPSGLSSYEP